MLNRLLYLSTASLLLITVIAFANHVVATFASSSFFLPSHGSSSFEHLLNRSRIHLRHCLEALVDDYCMQELIGC